MTAQPPDLPESEAERLRFLCRVVQREAAYLQQTDGRLFADPPNIAELRQLASHPELSEMVDAFVARLSRLQDGVADKLLPALLTALAETPGSTLDNLNRAERLGWLDSAVAWTHLRRLRNRLVHEYVEDSVVLLDALLAAHGSTGMLVETAGRVVGAARRRLSE